MREPLPDSSSTIPEKAAGAPSFRAHHAITPWPPALGRPRGPAWSTRTISIPPVPSALPAGASKPFRYNLISASLLFSILHVYLPRTGILC